MKWFYTILAFVFFVGLAIAAHNIFALSELMQIVLGLFAGIVTGFVYIWADLND